MRKVKLLSRGAAIAVALLLAGPLLRMASDTSVLAQDWRSASSKPAGWAPMPADHEPAVVQAYAAPAVRWRGAFGDHTWIAVKAAGATQYRRYEVIGFRLRRTGSVVVETQTMTPDQEWYGAKPTLLQDIRGAQAEKIIAALPAAVASYPYPGAYHVWPGPNSNTFTAHLARAVPELQLALPGRALGKDFIGWRVFAPAPSGTGFQLSLGGIFGVLVAAREGFEINLFGLVVGVDPMDFAVTIPGIGHLSARSQPQSLRMTSSP